MSSFGKLGRGIHFGRLSPAILERNRGPDLHWAGVRPNGHYLRPPLRCSKSPHPKGSGVGVYCESRQKRRRPCQHFPACDAGLPGQIHSSLSGRGLWDEFACLRHGFLKMRPRISKVVSGSSYFRENLLSITLTRCTRGRFTVGTLISSEMGANPNIGGNRQRLLHRTSTKGQILLRYHLCVDFPKI